MGTDDTVYVALTEHAYCVEEFLRKVTAWEGSAEDELAEAIEAAEKLSAALDHPVEREEEFRVVGEYGGRTRRFGPIQPSLGRLNPDRYRDGAISNVRIQSRTVTRTEWRDVEEPDHDQA